MGAFTTRGGPDGRGAAEGRDQLAKVEAAVPVLEHRPAEDETFRP
jgi:hypothetical protein